MPLQDTTQILAASDTGVTVAIKSTEAEVVATRVTDLETASNAIAKQAKLLSDVETLVDSFLIGACAAEVAENAAAGVSNFSQFLTWPVGAAGFIADAVFLGTAGRNEIKSVQAKIRRRVERIGGLVEILKNGNLTATGQWDKILENYKADRIAAMDGTSASADGTKKAVKARKASVDNGSAAASSISTSTATLGVAANPLSLLAQVAWYFVWPFALVFGAVAGWITHKRSHKCEKLKEKAQELRSLEIQLLELAKEKATTGKEIKEAKADEGKELVAAAVNAFDDTVWNALQEDTRRKIRELESLAKDKIAAAGVAGIFGTITGVVIYAVGISFGIVFSIVFAPLLLLAAAVTVGLMAGAAMYRVVAGKISTAAHHCLNKIRVFLGLESVDGKQSGFSAATALRVSGAFLGLLSLLTAPVVGWIVAGVAAVCFMVSNFCLAHYVSKREAKRRNLAKEVKKELTQNLREDVVMEKDIQRVKQEQNIQRTAAEARAMIQPLRPLYEEALAARIRTASIGEHVAAAKVEKAEVNRGGIGFFKAVYAMESRPDPILSTMRM